MKILIAEDQPSSALLLRRLLERMGYDVALARDGDEAWMMASAEPFPIIISDWVMPGMDGLEFCRKVREQDVKAYCYMILLTSKQAPGDRLNGLRAGADDFLVKPVDIEELAVRLEVARRILGVYNELKQHNTLLDELIRIDELTGIKNRRHFREALEFHINLATRQGKSLSLVILDVDRFKDFNDQFGHPAGDEVLKAVAGSLRENARKHDEVARIGGEEFAVLLPETDAALARDMAERLRQTLASREWSLRPITASFGIATTAPGPSLPSELIEQADKALYRSKHAGRNRVIHFEDPVVETEIDSLAELEPEPVISGGSCH